MLGNKLKDEGKSSRGSSSDSTERQGELKGETRITKTVFYVSGIDASCPEDTLVNYCLTLQVRRVLKVSELRIFGIKVGSFGSLCRGRPGYGHP